MEKKYVVRGEKGYQVSLEKIWGSQPNESASTIYTLTIYKELRNICMPSKNRSFDKISVNSEFKTLAPLTFGLVTIFDTFQLKFTFSSSCCQFYLPSFSEC